MDALRFLTVLGVTCTLIGAGAGCKPKSPIPESLPSGKATWDSIPQVAQSISIEKSGDPVAVDEKAMQSPVDPVVVPPGASLELTGEFTSSSDEFEHGIVLLKCWDYSAGHPVMWDSWDQPAPTKVAPAIYRYAARMTAPNTSCTLLVRITLNRKILGQRWITVR